MSIIPKLSSNPWSLDNNHHIIKLSAPLLCLTQQWLSRWTYVPIYIWLQHLPCIMIYRLANREMLPSLDLKNEDTCCHGPHTMIYDFMHLMVHMGEHALPPSESDGWPLQHPLQHRPPAALQTMLTSIGSQIETQEHSENNS